MEQPLTRKTESSTQTVMEEVFCKFGEMFKQFKEGEPYGNFDEIKIYFNSSMLVLDDITDIEVIMDEMNNISSRIYMYGVIYESQQRVLQELEDEFERWLATRYTLMEHSIEEEGGLKAKGIIKKKLPKTEGGKEKLIIYGYDDEYGYFKQKVRDEKYRLGLVKRVCNALDSYSYKLHAMLTYRQLVIEKGL